MSKKNIKRLDKKSNGKANHAAPAKKPKVTGYILGTILVAGVIAFMALGGGMVMKKFTGSRGKSGANDANAEYIGVLRNVMDQAGVTWQTAELGKVDYGGGGTISYIAALYGMEVIDCGVPVLNMHAPWEIISKADLYEAAKGYHAFLNMQ